MDQYGSYSGAIATTIEMVMAASRAPAVFGCLSVSGYPS